MQQWQGETGGWRIANDRTDYGYEDAAQGRRLIAAACDLSRDEDAARPEDTVRRQGAAAAGEVRLTGTLKALYFKARHWG